MSLLIKKGVTVTAYVRDAGKGSRVGRGHVIGSDARKQGAAKLAGAQLATGTLEDIKTFESAIKGHERLFLLTNAQNLENGLAQAAKAAGVKHIVRISCWLASRLLLRSPLAV